MALMTLKLLNICLLWCLVAADSPSHVNYRASTNQVASKVIGSNGKSESLLGSVASGSAQEAPRVRESFLRQLEEPERWAQYVPETSGTVAAELSEARREAREMEQQKAQEQRAEEQMHQQQQQIITQNQNEEKHVKRSRDASSKKRPSSTLKRAVQRLKASTKKAERRAIAKLEHFLDLDDDDDDDNISDLEDDDDGYHSDDLITDAGAASPKRQSKKMKSGVFSRLWNLTKSIIIVFYVASKWSSWNLFWVPTTYIGEAVRWSASTSWKTTRWTGERALVGPALTAGAPVIYLAEGLLFLFVWTPARVIGILVRELYPVYIYLGAALAVGTAMGIASAIILYIGSFFLSDSSIVEVHIARRADQIPEDLSRRYKQRRKSSAGNKWIKQGESVIERAIQESLRQREKRQSPTSLGQNQQLHSESDEDDDDYFGQGLPAMSKGKARGNGTGHDVTLSGSSRRTPPHFGPPSMPVGATGQGGWSSSSSSPAVSPVTVRSNIPSSTSFSYTSARSKGPSLSPLASPDVVRSASSRQRRNVSTAN